MRRYEHVMTDFPLPDSTQMERQLLRSVISDMSYFSELQRIVKPEFFSEEKSRSIWRVITDMYNKGENVDLNSIFARVDRKHLMDLVMGDMIYGQSIIQLGMALYDTYVKRMAYFRSIAVLQNVNSGAPAETIMSMFSDFTKEVTDMFDSGTKVKAIDVINKLADNIQSGNKTRITTPFSTLNFMLYGGFGGGNLVILAARPSVGKTTIALQMAQVSSMNGYPTTFYSLEMTDEELVQRMIVGTGLVDAVDIYRGSVNWENYEKAAQMAISKNLFINDRAKSLDDICTNITLDAQKGKCKIAFVDYLGLIRHDDRRKTFAQVIGDITGRLKSVAKECNIPIVLLAQLNRESAKEARSPQLTDLRDSGSIEQDADVVIMLERPRNEMGEVIKDHIDLWLRKNRAGQCNFENAIHLVGNSNYSSFKEETQPITVYFNNEGTNGN